MKKLIALISVLTVLAFAVTAFALHQAPTTEYTPSLVKAKKASIELGGEFRVRGNHQNNASNGSSVTNDTSDKANLYDERVRLGLKAATSANSYGFLELETGSSSDVYTWGETASGQKDGIKRGTMSIRQAYIAHQGKALGTLAGFKAGHLLAALGNNLFFDHSKFGEDGIVLWAAAGPGEVSLTTLKLSEDDTAENDDADAYIVGVEMPVGGMNISADLTNIKTRQDSDTPAAAFGDEDNLYNIGARINAEFGAIKVRADVEKQFGTDDVHTAAGQDEDDYTGFALLAGAEANVGPVAVRGNFAYGSGDDDGATDDEIANFQTFLSNQQNYTFIYEYTVNSACNTGTATAQTFGKNTGLCNTWYLNAGVTAKPMEELKVTADAYFLRAIEKVAINGNASQDRDLGFEVDAKAEYQIDTNLAYYVEAGYLFAGDAYELSNGDDPDNPYRVRHGVILKF